MVVYQQKKVLQDYILYDLIEYKLVVRESAQKEIEDIYRYNKESSHTAAAKFIK
jgi:ABC-type ATPase involved in cell division